MKCSTCRNHEATHSVWSAGWIYANMPPLQVCTNCCKLHLETGCIEGQEAFNSWKAVKEHIIWSDPEFDSLQSEILLNGDIIRGREAFTAQSRSITLLSRLAVSYKEDYWIVTKFSMLNLGDNTFWLNRLEFR